MNMDRVGKLISKLRHDKKMTQQELGDKLGVSYKTISKWECGKGLPDISILKDISRIFNISIDELLSGEIKEINEFNKDDRVKKIYIIIVLLFSLLIVMLLFIRYRSNNIDNDIVNSECMVIRTYYIDSIGKSNDSNYLYITVHEFQVEGTYTLKLSKLISEKLEVGKSYEFTFSVDNEYIDVDTDKLFNQGEVLDIEYTDKEGLDRVSKYYCGKEGE